MSYKITTSIFGESLVFNTDTSSWIPNDESNSEYQAYLAWVAEGNTAEEWTGN